KCCPPGCWANQSRRISFSFGDSGTRRVVRLPLTFFFSRIRTVPPARWRSWTRTRSISDRPGTSVGGEGEQRVHPAVGGVLPDVFQQRLDLGKLEEQAIPQLGLLGFAQAPGGDLPFDLGPGHKRWLLVVLGVDQALAGERPVDQPGVRRPVPQGAEARHLLL